MFAAMIVGSLGLILGWPMRVPYHLSISTWTWLFGMCFYSLFIFREWLCGRSATSFSTQLICCLSKNTLFYLHVLLQVLFSWLVLVPSPLLLLLLETESISNVPKLHYMRASFCHRSLVSLRRCAAFKVPHSFVHPFEVFKRKIKTNKTVLILNEDWQFNSLYNNIGHI